MMNSEGESNSGHKSWMRDERYEWIVAIFSQKGEYLAREHIVSLPKKVETLDDMPVMATRYNLRSGQGDGSGSNGNDPANNDANANETVDNGANPNVVQVDVGAMMTQLLQAVQNNNQGREANSFRGITMVVNTSKDLMDSLGHKDSRVTSQEDSSSNKDEWIVAIFSQKGEYLAPERIVSLPKKVETLDDMHVRVPVRSGRYPYGETQGMMICVCHGRVWRGGIAIGPSKFGYGLLFLSVSERILLLHAKRWFRREEKKLPQSTEQQHYSDKKLPEEIWFFGFNPLFHLLVIGQFSCKPYGLLCSLEEFNWYNIYSESARVSGQGLNPS
ncbi:hypothetical protein LguiA_002233 [Lonicera macranthoides]